MVAQIIYNKPSGSPIEFALGVPILQPPQAEPVYSKYESLNNLVSDSLHSGEWEEEIIAAPTSLMGQALLTVVMGDKDVPLTADMGIIVRLAGRLAGKVVISQGRVLSETEALAEEGVSGKVAPRYHKWDFFIKSVLLTDGPQRRERLHRSYEQQKQDEIGAMATAIREAFQSAMQGQAAVPPSALEKMEPEQLIALAHARMAEKDEEQFEAQQAMAAEVATEKAKNAKVPKAG